MNPRQTKFAQEYVQNSNATQAAIKAGYSKKTAYSQGQRLLSHVEVAAFIETQQAQTTERVGLSQRYVLEGLMGIAENDKSPASSQVRAYELLGKHQGMFGDRLEITQVPDTAQVLEWIDAAENYANTHHDSL